MSIVNAHDAVFADRSLDPGKKERLELQACIKVAQGAGSLRKTKLRTYSGRTMRTQMIDSLNPMCKFCVKLLQAVRMVIGQLQGAFKTLLKCVKTAFHLPLAPGRIRLRV